MVEICVCKHPYQIHRDLFTRIDEDLGSYCWDWDYEIDRRCGCIKFKLDNLKYVEDLAKERQLI